MSLLICGLSYHQVVFVSRVTHVVQSSPGLAKNYFYDKDLGGISRKRERQRETDEYVISRITETNGAATARGSPYTNTAAGPHYRWKVVKTNRQERDVSLGEQYVQRG